MCQEPSSDVYPAADILGFLTCDWSTPSVSPAVPMAALKLFTTALSLPARTVGVPICRLAPRPFHRAIYPAQHPPLYRSFASYSSIAGTSFEITMRNLLTICSRANHC